MDTKTHDYVATPTEIGELAKVYFTAQEFLGEGRVTYLRALLATTQERIRLTKAEPLAALESVHASFYAPVLAAAQETVPQRTPQRAILVNRKSNFARSSMSLLRAWTRKEGNDLMKLVPKRVTKAALVVPHKARAPSPARLKAAVEAASKALVTRLLALGERDHATAAEELELLMGQLTDQLGAITGTASARAVKRFQAAKTQVLTRTEVARALGAP
jgi:hypothetical protein